MKHDDVGDDLPAHDGIRAALAGLRHDEPIPEAVGARLDQTLAALVSARDADAAVTADAADEVPAVGGTRRDRRPRDRRPLRLVLAGAAAAAAAIAVGGPLLAGLDDGTMQSADGGAESSTASRSQPPGGATTETQGTPEPQETPPTPESAAAASAVADLPVLTRQAFAADVQRELSRRAGRTAAGSGPTSEAPLEQLDAGPATCDAGIAPSGRQQAFVADLDGRPVLVVAGPRRAAAYACGTATDRGRSPEDLSADAQLPPAPEPVISRRLD